AAPSRRPPINTGHAWTRCRAHHGVTRPRKSAGRANRRLLARDLIERGVGRMLLERRIDQLLEILDRNVPALAVEDHGLGADAQGLADGASSIAEQLSRAVGGLVCLRRLECHLCPPTVGSV